MKSQNTRGGKQSSFSGNFPGSHQNATLGYNGQRKNLAKSGGQNNSLFSNGALASESQNKLISLLANATGKTVVSTVSSGAKYKGVLLSLNIGSSGEDALSVVLLKPILISKPLINEKSNVDHKLPGKMVIESKDLIDIQIIHSFPAEVPEIKEKTPELIANTQTETTTETTIPSEPREEATLTFKTDRDISAGFNLKERELQRWVPDEDTPVLTLEGDSGGNWDQFKVNEERFGVQSSYDEHLYTTKINTQAKDYKDRLLRAEKLAKEIEGLTTSDLHVLEERGITVDDSGLDEEDKYSGVIQDTTIGDTRGNELMAALRKAKISNEIAPAPAGEGKYTTPRQRAAQYHDDPAIVSSSATKKDAPGKTIPNVAVKPGPASIPQKPQVPEHLGEAFRLNAQSEFNALREFSANFKIPHKIPNDLLPILAKDKLKQDEILRKQENLKNGVKADPVSSTAAPASASGSAAATKDASSLADAKANQKAVATGASAAKKEPTKFKLNPKAAAFTPSKPIAISPVPAKAGFNKSPSTSSPRLHSQRPFSNSLSGSSTRRHHQISAADFFGGADKVPTAETQKQKAKLFKESFNLFVTAVRKHVDKSKPLVFEKAYKTPPTWDSTVDESYDQFVEKISSSNNQMKSPAPGGQFMGSPIMTGPNNIPPMIPGGYMGAAGNTGKFSMSPHPQQPMAGQFQQPFHPSMMYPQFQGGVPPGQPQMMYAPPGVDPLFLPPGGFMVPGYMGSPTPMSGGATFQSMNPQTHHAGQNLNNHYGGRRYNQGKRASNAAEVKK